MGFIQLLKLDILSVKKNYHHSPSRVNKKNPWWTKKRALEFWVLLFLLERYKGFKEHELIYFVSYNVMKPLGIK